MNTYMTTQEFFDAVVDAATGAGYGWLSVGRHHPEDIAANLAPVMAAFAAGMSEAIRRQAKGEG